MKIRPNDINIQIKYSKEMFGNRSMTSKENCDMNVDVQTALKNTVLTHSRRSYRGEGARPHTVSNTLF